MHYYDVWFDNDNVYK